MVIFKKVFYLAFVIGIVFFPLKTFAGVCGTYFDNVLIEYSGGSGAPIICSTAQDCENAGQGNYCDTSVTQKQPTQTCTFDAQCPNFPDQICENRECVYKNGQSAPTENTPTSRSKFSSIIPDCALADPSSGQYCNDISSLIELGIKVGQFLFSIIGGLAFVMFIYGGVVMILSFGNPEKFKQGRNTLVAAVIGLAIAFGAYILINFILDALTVGEGFRAIK